MRDDSVQRSDLTLAGSSMSGNIYMLAGMYYKTFDIILTRLRKIIQKNFAQSWGIPERARFNPLGP
jgi:hypothetical protein